MNTYERLSIPSALHRVKVRADSIQLSAIDESLEALERFQPIVHEARENEGDGYEIVATPYKTNRYPGGLYTTIVLKKIEN